MEMELVKILSPVCPICNSNEITSCEVRTTNCANGKICIGYYFCRKCDYHFARINCVHMNEYINDFDMLEYMDNILMYKSLLIRSQRGY